jgi:hypothetical protein
MVTKGKTPIIAKVFLTLLLVNTVFCPCRGIAKILSMEWETEEAYCDCCCRHGDEQAPVPVDEEDNCDCRDGCCGHFLLPNSEVHLDAVTYGPVPVPSPSADGLDVPCASFVTTGHLKSPFFTPFGGSLFPTLSSLLT